MNDAKGPRCVQADLYRTRWNGPGGYHHLVPIYWRSDCDRWGRQEREGSIPHGLLTVEHRVFTLPAQPHLFVFLYPGIRLAT